MIFETGLIPPNIHFERPDARIDSLNARKIRPVMFPTKFSEELIAINNFGFGGSNIHMILKKPGQTRGMPKQFKFPSPKVYPLPDDCYSGFYFDRYAVKYDVDLLSAQFDCLKDHVVGSRNIFPTTGYLWVLWHSYHYISDEFKHNIPMDETFVEFSNVKIERAIPLNHKNVVNFETTFLKSNGKFVMKESGSVCVTGIIKMGSSKKGDFGKNNYFIDYVEKNDKSFKMDGQSLYQEYKSDGWLYGPKFQTMIEMDMESKCGKVKFDEDWISFADGVLQVHIFTRYDGGIKIPNKINYFYCDMKHLLQSKAENDGIFLMLNPV